MMYVPRHASSTIYPLPPPTKSLFQRMVKAVKMIRSGFVKSMYEAVNSALLSDKATET